ncbi:tetratricopeptide repeat protein [uncultured Kordia sp.]|uniref:tetratricopeptide repeat-containing sensor histidine kinase n=1 Tax=uncultured Kordia sp. TaxID=507699 RepID=UPI00260C5DEF|nr:tetratricopeptide repeat protein [uncultured Kordia sp.]
MNTIPKYLFLFLVVVSFSGTMHAQNAVVDSLQNELRLHTQKDTIRVNLLSSLIHQVYDLDVAQAETLLKEAEEISNTLQYTKGKATVNYYKGHIEIIKYNFEKSIQHFDEAYKLYENINDFKGMARCYASKGYAYYDSGDYTKSLVYYNKSIPLYKKSNNIKGLASTLNNIAGIYADQGKYYEAIKKYTESKDIKEKLHNLYGVAKLYTNIGGVYGEMNNYTNALENLKKAEDIYDSIAKNRKSWILLSNIGIIYSKQKQYDKALDYYNKSLAICEQQENKLGIADNYNKIGNIYKAQSKNEEALNLFHKALIICKDISDKKGMLISYTGLANCYFLQRNYKTALEYTLKIQATGTELKMLPYQQEAHKLLADIYENLGEPEKSLANYKKFKTLSDSLLNKEINKKIIQFEFDYKYKQELEQANKKVETTTKDLQKSKYNFLLGIIIFLGITLVLVTIIFFLRLRNVNIKNQNVLTEQKLLRSQMTPHFIFNALSVLQGIILNKEEEKSLTYLSKFSRLLRITLENSRDKIVSLDQELIAVENYLALQNIKSNFSYEYTIFLDDSIDKNLFEIPPMLIQPFIENAFEHAVDKQKKELKIQISLKYLNNELICTIIDNGLGINSQKENTKKHKKSLATTITSERLTILSKNLKTKGAITIEDREKYNERGTIVTLIIPHKLKSL